MTDTTYRWCYRILDISPSCDWQELRMAYRRKVHTCHPDLAVQGDERAHDVVGREERFKETVRAFRLLANYYRQHGELPRPQAPLATFRPGERDPVIVPGGAEDGRQTVNDRARERTALGIPRFHLFAVAGFFVTVTVTAAANYLNVANEPPPVHAGGSGSLEFGMKPGDVMNLQGVPNFTRGSVWFYGDSGIVFDRGCVVGWENTPPFPLRTDVPVNSLREQRERHRDSGANEERDCRFDGR